MNRNMMTLHSDEIPNTGIGILNKRIKTKYTGGR